MSAAKPLQRRHLLAAAGLSATGLLGACATPFGSALPGTQSPVQAAAQAHAASDGSAAGRRLQSIAFGACIDQTKPQPIWVPVLAAKPDLFVFGGDNVYAAQQPFKIEALESAYNQLAASPGFAALRRSTPHLAIWDDNDYGLSDGDGGWPFKQVAKEAFLKFWNVDATDPRRSRDGLYHAQSFGPLGERVQVILLDMRSARSSWTPTDLRDAPGKERYLQNPDPTKTMLGTEQWRWLETQLREPADVRLIVSGVQVLVNGHGWECWALFPHERQRLYDTIARNKANGVLFLTGERHYGALYLDSTSGPYPLYEMTSSGLTHAWAKAREPGPNRLGELVTENHFGLIDIDWTERKLKLIIQNESGVNVRQQDIALAQLRARRELM